MNAMDFDDLLFRCVDLLELFPEVRERYAERLPARAGRRVPGHEPRPVPLAPAARADEHRNLCVVGDDDQSIYGFRGADIRNILDFEKDFPDARVIKLEQNYRSTQTILDAANALIANNRGQMAKHLWTDEGQGDRDQGPPARGRARRGALRRRRDRAARRLGHLARRDRGLLPDQRAVARARGHARPLRRRLPGHRRHEVLRARRGQGRDRVPDAARQPGRRVAFQRVVNSPRRGIGNTTQGRIVSHANTIGESVWDVALAPEQVPGLGAAAIKAVGALHVDDGAAARAGRVGASVGDLIQEMLDRDRLPGRAARPSARSRRRAGSRTSRSSSASGASSSRASRRSKTLEAFLQQIALFADTDGCRRDEGVVTLMTLHNAKGLEFPIVFIIGMEEGVFPHMRSIEAGDVEEERRLAYVGVTRAMRDLYLTYARAAVAVRRSGARTSARASSTRSPRTCATSSPGAAQVVEHAGTAGRSSSSAAAAAAASAAVAARPTAPAQRRSAREPTPGKSLLGRRRRRARRRWARASSSASSPAA